MAVYAIGDIQGCFEPLQRLLARIHFEPAHDRLWLTGDLVNRGPDSLAVLHWARALGDRVTLVLGNHELRLLACADGVIAVRRRDTFADVLQARDRGDLLDWLRGQPFLHREGNRVMVHAGLHPAWTVGEAEALAAELADALRPATHHQTLEALRNGSPSPAWHDSLTGDERLRTIAAALTRLRTCTIDGRMCLDYEGPPQGAPEGCLPWFEVPGRRSREAAVVFGHWAALGFHRAPGVLALDSGCARGQALTAVRLEDGQVFQEPARAWVERKSHPTPSPV